MSAGAAGEAGGDAGATGAGALGAGAGDGGTGSAELGGKQGGQTSPQVTIPDWAKGFTPELQGVIGKKGWQTPEALVESYTNLESKLGAGPNELLKLPKEGDQAALDEFYTKLGRPAKPEDYQTDLKFAEGEPSFLDWFRKAAYAEGVPQKSFDKLAKGFEEQRLAFESAIEGEFAAKAETALKTLKSEWGNSWDSNIALAKAGAKTLGFNTEVLSVLERAIGTEAMMKTMLKVGLSISDSPGGEHGSAQSAGAMTAEQARAEIAKINADRESMMAWTTPDHTGHSEMKRKMDQLFRIAYPG